MKKGFSSALSAVAGGITGAVAGACVVARTSGKEVSKAKGLADKHLALFLMMNQWVRVKQEGKNLSSYFEKNNYKKIAIYGMSYAGETLVQELKETGIDIVYGIDRNADGIYSDIELFSMEDELPETDVVIVTAITFFNQIEEELAQKVDCPIISLEDVLYEV